MKKLYDFIYCQDEFLTREVIFYLVRVGTSKRDQKALRYVRRMTKGASYIAIHDTASQQFVEKCATTLYSGRGQRIATALIRRKMVEITWLANFLRSAPAALLNSLKIPCQKPLL